MAWRNVFEIMIDDVAREANSRLLPLKVFGHVLLVTKPYKMAIRLKVYLDALL